MKSWFDKITRFFGEVREEVVKCTRPSTEELKESTFVVVFTMATLGCFIFGSDLVISQAFGLFIAR